MLGQAHGKGVRSKQLSANLQLVLLLCSELSSVLEDVLVGPVELLQDGFSRQHVPGLVQQLPLRGLGLEGLQTGIVCVAVGAGIK